MTTRTARQRLDRVSLSSAAAADPSLPCCAYTARCTPAPDADQFIVPRVWGRGSASANAMATKRIPDHLMVAMALAHPVTPRANRGAGEFVPVCGLAWRTCHHRTARHLGPRPPAPTVTDLFDRQEMTCGPRL